MGKEGHCLKVASVGHIFLLLSSKENGEKLVGRNVPAPLPDTLCQPVAETIRAERAQRYRESPQPTQPPPRTCFCRVFTDSLRATPTHPPSSYQKQDS